LNFHRFWTILEEKPVRVVGDADVPTVARTWKSLGPQSPAHEQLNLNEVWRMVMLIGDPANNRAWKETVLLGVDPPEKEVYSNRLESMVNVPNIKGTVAGRISPKNARFHCENRKLESHVLIAPAPLEYGKDDLAMLSSIVVHELRHAMDFHEIGAMDVGSYFNDKGTHMEINMDLYAQNVLEARAHADQVKYLIKIMGGGDKAKRILVESTLARGLVPRLRECMIEFIDMACEQPVGESWNPPAIVARAENHAEQAVDLVKEICESFKFSRYVDR